MKKLLWLVAIFIASPAYAAGNLLLTSPLFEDGKQLPRSAAYNADGCNGENISPTLDWSGAPEGTLSYAISMFDPDANNGAGWVHWVAMNIPLNPTSLAPNAGATAAGDNQATGMTMLPNSYKQKAYSGACPPNGTSHHYEFTVYAMPTAQTFYPLSTVDKQTITWLHDHALESSTLTVNYSR